MSIIVCIKQVPDTETKIHLLKDTSGIEEENIQWILNPYDEYALEEALLFKEKREKAIQTKETKESSDQKSTKVHAITVGPKRSKEVLLKALAMGADLGTHIQTDLKLDSFVTAKAIAHVIKLENKPLDMIFTGQLSIDQNQSAVPQMLAEFLNLPHVISVIAFNSSHVDPYLLTEEEMNQKRKIQVQRSTEKGDVEILEIKGPTVIGANKGLNHPRTIRIPALIKAKRKPLKVISFEELNDYKNKVSQELIPSKEEIKLRWKNFFLPKKRQPIFMIQGETTKEKIKILIQKIKEEEKLI